VLAVEWRTLHVEEFHNHRHWGSQIMKVAASWTCIWNREMRNAYRSLQEKLLESGHFEY